MDERKKEEIINFIISGMQNEISHILGTDFTLVKRKDNIYNEISDCYSIQIYFDEAAKVYLYYDIGRKLRQQQKEICTKINAALISNFYRETCCNLEIVGPNGKYRPTDVLYVSQVYQDLLTTYTFSYWKNFNGAYQFIEDKQKLFPDHNIHFTSEKIEENKQKEKDFKDAVLEINHKYNFAFNNNSIPKAFEEYAKLYKSVYGRDLKTLPDSDISYLFLDAYSNHTIV